MNSSLRLPGIEHIALSHRAPKGGAQRERDYEKVKRSNGEGHGERINSDLVNPWYLQFYREYALYGNICLKIFYICMQLCILFLMGNSMNNTSVQKKINTQETGIKLDYGKVGLRYKLLSDCNVQTLRGVLVTASLRRRQERGEWLYKGVEEVH